MFQYADHPEDEEEKDTKKVLRSAFLTPVSYNFDRRKVGKGASLNYVGRRWREGGLAKCLCYYISLCSKLAYGGGRGGQKLAKSCLRSLRMPPYHVHNLTESHGIVYHTMENLLCITDLIVM